MAAHKVATLLKVRSSLGANEATDGKRHVGTRYLPWFRNEDLAKDPGATIKQLFADLTAAAKAGAISGTTNEGEVVENKPFNTTGTGKSKAAPTYELIGAMLARGFTLANQQEMHEVLFEKFGKEKAKQAAAATGGEEDI